MINSQVNLTLPESEFANKDISNKNKFSNIDTFINYFSGLKEIIPKDSFIIEQCKDKSVLDLGCIDHTYEQALKPDNSWLHAQIKNVAKDVTGIDILAADAAELNRRGFHIEVANVETFDLGKKFDVIVAGDLIEHVSNIGLFLNATSRHMHSNSIFIITTPNPFNIEQFAQALFRNKIYANPEHTAWIDPRVMYQIVARSPLQIVNFRWIDTKFKFRLKGGRITRRLINPLAEVIMKKRPICRRDFAVILKLKTNNQQYNA